MKEKSEKGVTEGEERRGKEREEIRSERRACTVWRRCVFIFFAILYSVTAFLPLIPSSSSVGSLKILLTNQSECVERRVRCGEV